MNRIFGYDYFISYAQADGQQYSISLARELRRRGRTCFLDIDHYRVGDDWKGVGFWMLRNTTCLVVVGSPMALRSQPVLHELQVFRRFRKQVMPIEFDGSLGSNSAAESELVALLPSTVLRLAESAPTAGPPSESIVARLVADFQGLTQDRKRLRWVAAAALTLAMTTGGAMYFAALATRSEITAKARLAEAQQAESVRLAQIADRLIAEGDAPSAALVALEALPSDFASQDRLLVADAVSAMRRALVRNREIGELVVQGAPPRCARFLKGDSLLVLAQGRGPAWYRLVWDGRPESVVSVTRIALNPGTTIPTADCGWLVTLGSDGVVVVRASDDDKTVAEAVDAPSAFTAAAYDARTRWLAISGPDGRIVLWNMQEGRRPVGTLVGHQRENAQLVFSRDGTKLASAGYDRTARAWSLVTKSSFSVANSNEHVLAVGWSDDTNLLHVGSYTGLASMHDAATGTLLDQRLAPGEKIKTIVPLEGKVAAFGFDSGRVAVWASKWPMPDYVIRGPGSLDHLAVSDDRSRLVATFGSGTVRVIDVSSATDERVFKQVGDEFVFSTLPDVSGKALKVDFDSAKEVAVAVCRNAHRPLSAMQRLEYLGRTMPNRSGGEQPEEAFPRLCTTLIPGYGSASQRAMAALGSK